MSVVSYRFGTITGIQNGDNITATYASAATAASPIGIYPIVATLIDPAGKLPNYIVVINNATLTVNPAPLTVTAANASRAFAAANPVFTGTITGIKNGDNITATYASAATSTSPVGTYPIVPTLADPTNKLGNYTVTSNNGTLTVVGALLTVTADNASRLYGDPNPVFTGTIIGIQNGDNITATYATAATVASNAGTYAIVPTLVDPTNKLGNYTVVVNNGALTVSPVPLTVAAANATRIYGDPNPVFTGTITGLRNGDNITATYSSADPTAAVGTYPIVPTLVDPTNKLGNYTVTSNNGTLTVSPAALTVTAANASRAFGAANPVFSGTITGIKNADNITATYASAATPASPVGTYPIVPTLVDPAGKLSNYTVTSNNGTLTVSAATLIVTAANASRLYGDPNPAFTGTITGIQNGDNITATFSTIATPASSVGSYAIVPSLIDPAGKLVNYTVVVNNGILTVSPAPLTVTAANAIHASGTPNPVFTGIITGIKNGDNITATYATTATQASPAGTYPIVPTLVDPTNKLGNYTVTSNNGTLTVTGAILTVTAANVSRLYGDPNPVFTGTITGIIPGDNITATYTTTATPTSPIGTYAIVATVSDNGTGALIKYTVTINNGTLTVAPAPLTVAAASATRLYGDPNPAFTGTITGIKNADNITATYASVATPASPVGTYSIVPTLVDPAGALSNYTVSSSNGTLTVSPAPLTVTAANASRAFGAANPVFSGTITGIKNADNISATYASAATPASPVGTYPIVPTLVDPTNKLGNYTVTSNNGTLTVSTATLTVNVANASRLYGDPNPAFTGTITGIQNGDNITATYASAATPASSIGTYSIVATLVDPAGKLINYTVVVNNGTLTVNPAPLSVTAANASRVYGSANPAFTGAITGIKNGDNITASYATVATLVSPVGSYAIVPTLSDPTTKLGNYAVTINNGVLTVSPAPLTVTAANATRKAGAPDPVFTGTITGIQNGDNITATYATTATSTSPAGIYPIVPTLVDPTNKLGNYTVTSNNGTLTVTGSILTVTAANASRLYGDPNPVFTGTLTGLIPGDNITATYASTATAASPVGSYTIVPTLVDPAGALVNYTVIINNATLVVNQAPLSVTAANASRTYGAANPAFTGTLTGIKNADNITATYASAATPASPAGNYSIVPTLVDPTNKLGNYTVTSNNGTLTVNDAPLTVNVASVSRLYADPNPVFTGTITGVLNGDNITATYTSVATTASSVGTYAILATLADPGNKLANYILVVNNGTLTINPVPLTVTVANASRVFGAANPVFTGTVTGVKNGDNITASYGTSATPSSPAGTYAIVPTLSDPTAKLGNYLVTINNGTLTVSPAPLTIAANASSKILNAANPAFTATYSGFVLGQNPSVLAGILSCTTTATTTSPVGPYPITCSGQTSLNYAITYVPSTLGVFYAPAGACTAGLGHTILNPILPDGTSTFRQGTRVTTQFRVCDVNGVSISTPGVVSSFFLVGIDATVVKQAPTAGPFAFVGGQQWSTTIDTNPLPSGSTYKYQIALNDGTFINFQFFVR